MPNPTYLGSEYVASGGNATIPPNCDLIVAGYASAAPSLGGVAMVSCGGSSGMYYTEHPRTGVQAVTGANVLLVYFANGTGGLQDADGAYSGTGLYSVTEYCDATCVVVGIASGSVGGIAQIVVSIAGSSTSIWTSGLTRVAYQILSAANPACQARDNGADGTVSGGFASFAFRFNGSGVPGVDLSSGYGHM